MLLKNLMNIIFILTMFYTSVPLFSVRKWCALMISSNCFLQDINKKKSMGEVRKLQRKDALTLLFMVHWVALIKCNKELDH